MSRRILLILFTLFASVAFAQWVPLGPHGGDARALAFDAQNPDRILLGTSAGQLFVSNNNGASWERFARVGSSDYVLDNIEIDPRNPKNIYVAAWSVERQTDAGDLFKSQDGGKTWQALPAMHNKSVRAFALAPSDPRILVAGALDGVFQSKDGGANWERISPPNHAEIKNIESIAIDPKDPNIVYAGTWHLAWKTIDGGKNWFPIKNGVVDDSDVFSIIVDHVNPKNVFLSACSGIYKSENAAELFRKVQGIPFSARRTRVLHFDPTNPSIVYAGTTEGLWKTTDAGKTWKRITEANIIINDVLVDPRRSDRVMIATDRSGILVSNSSGATFVASNRGFSHRQVSTVVVDRNDPNTIYAGVLNDKEFGGVLVSHDGGQQWKELNAGLAGRDVFTLKQAESGALIAGTNRGIFEKARGSELWRPISTVVREKTVPVKVTAKAKRGSKPVAKTRTELVKSEFSSRVAQVEFAAGKLFAATALGLLESQDNGKTWRHIEASAKDGYVGVSALGNRIAAASVRAAIYSADGGATWANSKLPSFISLVYAVAVAPDGVWVATREGAFRTTDGNNWDHVLAGLPSRNVVSITYDAASSRLLATSANGDLFVSTKGGDFRRDNNGYAIRALTPVPGRLLALTAFDGILAQREPGTATAASGGGASQK